MHLVQQRSACRTAHILGAVVTDSDRYWLWRERGWLALLNQLPFLLALSLSRPWMGFGVPVARSARHD